VFFVSLAPLGSADLIVAAIGEAVACHFQRGAEAKEQLLAFLRPMRALLLLDNFEHLVAGASIVSEILAAAPGLVVIATFVMYTLFPLLLAGAHTFPAFAVAFAVRGLKEFGEPARKSLILSYSPENARGATVGAYYLIRDSVVTTGSFIGAALWVWGPMVVFITAGAIGVLATTVYAASLRGWVRRSV